MSAKRRAGTCCQTLLRGVPHGPAIHIVSRQIDVGVAIRYRAGQAIEKFGTVKRNRADRMPYGATSPRVFDFIASYGSRGRCSRWPFVAVGIGRSSRSAENVEEDTPNDDDDREPYAQTVDKHHGSNSAMRIWASCHRVPVLQPLRRNAGRGRKRVAGTHAQAAAEKARGCPSVSPYRFKFSDCPAGAVPNSYPKLDLLWDNLIAGPWGVAPLHSA